MPAKTQEEFPVLPLNPFPLEDMPPKQHEDEKDKSFRERWNYWTKDCGHGWLYMFGHYFYSFLEFLLHHFFILSSSTRIYLISFFLLFGGTFYAVAPSLALGCAFFFGSIIISLALTEFSHFINDKIDREDREKQREINRVNKTYQLMDAQQTESKKSLTKKDKETPNGEPSAHHTPWVRIKYMHDSAFSWLNYKDVLDLAKSKYVLVIYFMDIVVVIAAVWNITEEILRWQAVLPFASVLTAMGPFWIIFTCSVLAAICLGLKMAYTHPMTQSRKKNVELLQKTRDTFEGVLERNKVLRQALNEIETKLDEKSKSVIDDEKEGSSSQEKRQLLAKTEQSKLDDPSPVKTRHLAFAISFLISAALTFGIYTALPVTVPLWAIILFSLFCFAILCYTGYKFLKPAITTYKIAKNNNESFSQRFRNYIHGIKTSFESEILLEDLKENYKTKAEKEAEKGKGKPKEPPTFWQRLGNYWKVFLSLGVSAFVTIGVHAAIASMPILPMAGILALSVILVTLAMYKILKLIMHYYEARAKHQNEARTQAAIDREGIEQEVAAQLKNAGGYTDEQIAKLTHLAYSIWKLKNMHRFKPQRNFIDYFLDNIGVPLWNAAVTIFPTFFILNGICVYIFLLPSVLSCWPLFLIELVPAILLAIDFGRRKLGDNEHDLIKDAAALIIDEITNEKNGTLLACTRGEKPITLESLGLNNLFKKEPEQDSKSELRSSHLATATRTNYTALRNRHNTLGLQSESLVSPGDLDSVNDMLPLIPRQS